MKKNYSPKKLTKKQRHMKKWIPDYIYCEGIYDKRCPFFRTFYNYKRKREECQFKDNCEDNCSECKQKVSYCGFLNYTEYGQYPLGDMCKICGIHEVDKKECRRNINGNWFKARGWKAKRKKQKVFNERLKIRMKLYPELFEGLTYDDLKETGPW